MPYRGKSTMPYRGKSTNTSSRRTVAWAVVIGAALTLIAGYLLQGPSRHKVAVALRNADMRLAAETGPLSYGILRLLPDLFPTLESYEEEIERLQEITGDSPREIGRVTLKYHEHVHMSCSAFLQNLCTQLSWNGRRKEPMWDSYEEAAKDFVDSNSAGWKYPPRP